MAVGLKYYPVDNFKKLYIGSDLGITVISENTSVSGPGFSIMDSRNETKFSFSPGIGYHFKTADITMRYNLISNASYFGLSLGLVLD